MKIKDAAKRVMESIHKDPVRQIDIIKDIVKLTGYSYESVRGNVFRNKDFVPWISQNFKKIKHNGYTSYIREVSDYKQQFNKPTEYYECLNYLNVSEKVFSLSGTESHCSKVIDSNKLIKVDKSSLIKDNVLRKDIFTIKEYGSYNLDFEGILTIKKINYINNLNFDYILLTYRSCKSDILLKKLKHRIIKSCEYKSGRSNMKIILIKSDCDYIPQL